MNSEPTPCPKCGRELPGDAPQGLCPRCLAALNFATETMPPDATPVATQTPLTPEELAPHFPQLEILGCLGRGGMGVVYKARQKSLNRLVALKLLAPERADDAKFAARFEKEAQALAALNHPHIVTIHDFGQAGGFFFLLMEFVDGVNLRQAMTAGRFTPEQALAVVPPVCEALQYAHEHGIVHRDIKPENLLMDKEGRVKIADFGIAKMIGAVTEEGGESFSQPFGTPTYAAPEQHNDPSHVDHRADIYSLGVVLYELLTGELPKDKLEPPSKRVQIDVRLDEVVLRALETRPEMRFATAAEFRTQLAEAVTTPPAKPAMEASPASPSRPRKWLGALGMVLGLVMLLGAPVLNEIVDDFGLTQSARKHLDARRRAEQLLTVSKTEVAAKHNQLSAARRAQNTAEADKLTREWQALQIKARQAEFALNQAAVLKQDTENQRIAVFYLIAGVLLTAGAIPLFPRQRSGKRFLRMGVAGVLCAWMLTMIGMHWRDYWSLTTGDPTRVVDRITLLPVAVEKNVCVVEIQHAVMGVPVEMRAMMTGGDHPAASQPRRDDIELNTGTSTLVLAGTPKGNLPWRLFQPGLHTWQLRFVLPTEELAREASKNLRPIGPMRVVRGQTHNATIFEIQDASGDTHRASLDFTEMVTAAHPHWVSLHGQRHWNDASLQAFWHLNASQAGVVRLSDASGTQTGSLQRNAKTQLHEVTAQIELTRLDAGRVRITLKVGGAQAMREITGDYLQLRDELLATALNSAKTERGATIQLCRLAGEPVLLEVPVIQATGSGTTTVAVPVKTVGFPMFALIAGLGVATVIVVGVFWMLRSAFKSRRGGCTLAAIILLGLLLVAGVFMLTLWFSYQPVRQVGSEVSQNAKAVRKAPSKQEAPLTAWEQRLQDDLLKHRQQKAELGKNLGPQHPQIKALEKQIAMLEKMIEQERNKPATGAPAFVADDSRFLSSSGTRTLNRRFTLAVNARPLIGKDGASSMRSYTLKDNLVDGTQGMATFAPLAIQNELFIIYWDREKDELWLASPSIVRWHHLPETSQPSDQMFIHPDIPAAMRQRMPAPLREAIARWHFAENRPEEQTTALGEKALSQMLQNTSAGSSTLIASLTREHSFNDDVPGGAEMECFRVSAGESHERVYLQKNEAVQELLRKLLPWGQTSLFTVTLKWRQEGAKLWLELLDATLFEDPNQR